MADRFAILPAATTSNWSNVNTWSASSGGATGASVPTSADATYVDSNSVAGASAVLSVNAAASCLSMDWTGATNTPTLNQLNPTLTERLYIAGSLTFISGMNRTGSGETWFTGAVTHNITSAGKTIAGTYGIYFSQGTINLIDVLVANQPVITMGNNSILNTNNYNVSTTGIYATGTSTITLTLGTSTINIGSAGFNCTSSNLTVSANTSTVNISGTGACALGSANWNGCSFALNGTAHTVSGSPTGINTIALPAATTQTITITAGSVIKCTTATLSGDATHAHTIQSGTAGTLANIWATNKTDSYVTYTDILRNYNGVIVADCSGAGGGTFAGGGGTFTSLTAQGAGNYALTITGSNTFTLIDIDASSATKTIKFTDGTTTSVYDIIRDTNGTNIITLTGTGTAGWAIEYLGSGVINLDYMDISYSTAT